jgi:hypothetical protein
MSHINSGVLAMTADTTKRGKRWMRRVAISALIIGALLGVAAFAALRTDLLLSSLEVGPLGSPQQANVVLRDLAAAHGSPASWARRPALTLRLRGYVPFFFARRAFGLDEERVRLTIRFTPAEHGRYRYVLHDGSRSRRGAVDTRADRDGLGLLLDSVRHLFELPFTARAIPQRRGLADGPNGEHRAFFTWGDNVAATSAHDQIVLWTRGGRLSRMDTTGRDIAPFIVARVVFEGSVKLGDHVLPRRATVYGSGGELIHRWEIEAAEPQALAAAEHRSRIGPFDVESCLLEHEAVAESAVLRPALHQGAVDATR